MTQKKLSDVFSPAVFKLISDALDDETDSDKLFSDLKSVYEDNPSKIAKKERRSASSKGFLSTKRMQSNDDAILKSVAQESVKNWLFKSDPSVLTSCKLTVSPISDFEEYRTNGALGNIDDGSFPDDPILRSLRKKLVSLSN